MSINSVTIPPNVNRYNDYNKFDRGLFIPHNTADGKAARIASARWMTSGDVAAPGVLRYTVEYFSEIPTNVGDLAQYRTGVSETEFVCITRTICDNPIVIEGFAIKHYLDGAVPPSEDDINNAVTLGLEMTKKVSNGGITSMETLLTFTSSDTTSLTLSEASISYIAKTSANGQNQTLQGTLSPEFNKIRPLYLVMQAVKEQTGA